MQNYRSSLIKIAISLVIIAIAAYLLFINISKGEGTVPDLTSLQSVEVHEQSWNTSQSSGVIQVDGMTFVGENEYLSLFINEVTTEVAVVNKQTQDIWYTNPPDRDDDPLATNFEKQTLGSQFYFSFADSQRTSRNYYNNQNSIVNEQFEIVPIEYGVRVNYIVGDLSRGVEVLPLKLSAERYDELFTNNTALSDSDRNYASRRWRLDRDNNVYERLDQGLTKRIELDRVIGVFDQIGYTEEDLNRDNLEHDLPPAEISRPLFEIPLEYRLDGEHLLVTIPFDEVTESEGMRIREFAFLPFFGAADQNQEGYILVPDGSGSIIHLNNGKSTTERYSQRVYGRDQTKEVRVRSQVSETARLPVFGIKQGDKAMFAIIEHGDALSVITADVSGRQNSYNSVFNRFTIRDYESIEMAGHESISVVNIDQPEIYNGIISIRYAFLNGEDSTYSGMAHYYQQYLLNNHHLAQQTFHENLPFQLNVVGAINKTQYFIGLPYKGTETLTTFAQATEIVDALRSRDITAIDLTYQGWFNQGFNHKNITKVKVDRKLGGKSSLKKLLNYVDEHDIALYPDVAFLNVYKKTSGFIASRDTARFINRKPAREAEIYLPTGRENYRYDPYYILSSARLPSFVNEFIKQYDKLGVDTISLRDLATVVNSDHRVSRPVNRQQALEIVKEQLVAIHEGITDIAVPEANAYALPYVNAITDIPLQCSGFIITDECVPFYQMVVHGFIPYSSQAINLNNEQGYEFNLLKHIEYGAHPKFTFGYEVSSLVKDTEFDYLYSIHYQDWLDYASDMYHELNGALKDLQTATIISHSKRAPNVFETKYSNGWSTIVNYNAQAVEIDGTTVEALGYYLGREER